MIWGTAAQAALARIATAAEMVRTLPMKPKNRLLPMFTSRPKPLSHTKGVGNLCTARNYSTETRSVGTLIDRGPAALQLWGRIVAQASRAVQTKAGSRGLSY